MTTLTLNYRGQLEVERANRAREEETARHNRETERIAQASYELAVNQFGLSKEQFAVNTANEKRRLDISQQVADNNYAIGMLNANVAMGQLFESIRHNKMNENAQFLQLSNDITRTEYDREIRLGQNLNQSFANADLANFRAQQLEDADLNRTAQYDIAKMQQRSSTYSSDVSMFGSILRAGATLAPFVIKAYLGM